MSKLEKIIIEPKDKADFAVIWLHGLGADGHDFEPLVPELKLSNTRFIFPHAPFQKVTLNAGMSMRAWFDISALNLQAKEDEVGIRSSEMQIKLLIVEQIQQGILAEHIFLVGFSQGAAIALQTGLRFPQRLAGIAALSGYLPLRNQLGQEIAEVQLKTPIFMAHGLYDPVLPFMIGEASKKFLEMQHLKVEWHSYSMDHSVCLEEVHDLKNFFEKSN